MTSIYRPISRIKKAFLGLLSLLLIVSGLSLISIVPAKAASGILTSDPCSVAVGETATAVVVSSGGFCYIAFKSGTNSFTVPANVSLINLLVIAGGGGGGSRSGGGGGAGGLKNVDFAVSASESVSITVGGGGAGAPTSRGAGSNGGNSSVVVGATTVTALGGGGGGDPGSGNAKNGGSGGGAAGGFAIGQATDSSQGKNGGLGLANTCGTSDYCGGGGGGAGGDGGTPTSSNTTGAGGVGLKINWLSKSVADLLDIGDRSNSTDVYFAGGGSGGGGGTTTPGARGLGGGAAGLTNTTSNTPIAAGANTGGGGGGGCYQLISGGSGAGGAGGSGVVVVRFASLEINGPSAPTDVQVTAGDGSLAVQWSAPANNGSHSISSYQVERSTDGATWTVASSSVSAATYPATYTITGLTPGTPYYVRVAAITSTRFGAYGYPWMKIYGTTQKLRNSDGSISYQSSYGPSDAPATSNPSFTRVRYLMKATYGGVANWADVNFSKTLGTASASSSVASNSAIPLSKLRFPGTATTADQVVIQGDINDLTVLSNLPNSTVQSGYGFKGRLEIWPWNYDVAPNGLNARAPGGIYDDADTMASSSIETNSYGSFQVHNESTSFQQTVLAWNRQISTGTADIGFGNYSGAHTDWTFANADSGYINAPRTNFSNEVFVNAPTAPLGAALTPTFGTATPTPTGFTVTITNYDAAYTWATPIVSSGTVAVTSTSGSNRVLTVSGLNPGTSATITQGTSRSGYTSGSATFTAVAALVVNLDAGNSSSYPGSGSTWTNLVNGGTYTISNGAYSADDGGSILFNGTSTYVSVGNPLSTGASFTYEAWVYNATSSGSKNIISTPSHPFFLSGTSLNGGLSGSYSLVTSANFPTNTWRHVVLTFSDSTNTMSLYIDGSRVAQNTSVTSSYSQEITRIGAHGTASAATSFWNGKISKAKIYNAALTGSQVTSNYDAEKTIYPQTTGLTPTFGSTSATSDGFTVSITNYDAAYTWATPTVSAGSVSAASASGSTQVLTVTGLSAGASATITQDTSRSGYTNGSGTVSGSALGAALTPSFGSPTATSDGFTVQINNYSNSYTWSGEATASGIVSIDSSGFVTVTGVAGATSSTATISTSRAGYVGGSATVSKTSLGTYVTTYNATTNGGTAISPLTVSYLSGSTALTLPTPVSRTGYTASGWYTTASSGGSKVGDAGDSYTPTSTATLYFRWSANTNTVTFDANGGSAVTSGSFLTGSTLTKPTNPTKSRKIFGGWSTSETGDQGNSANLILVWPYSSPATSNITLYAIWNEDQSISFTGTAATSARKVGTSGSPVEIVPKDRSFTWEAWIYPTGVSGTGSTKYASVLDNADDGSNYGRTWLYVVDTGSGPKLSIGYWVDANNGLGLDSAANSVSYNTWQHISMKVTRSAPAEATCSGSGEVVVTLYVNGTQVATDKDSSFVGCLNSLGLIVGDNNDDPNQQFKGKIDQVKIWEGALTDAEIKSSRTNFGSTGVDNTLRAHYGFNELGTTPALSDVVKNLASDTGTYDIAIYGTSGANVTSNVGRSLNSFDVTFGGNGSTAGSVSTLTANYPYETITVPTLGNLEKTGSTFTNWNTASNGTGTGYDPADSYQILYGGQTLYANWSTVTYTITYKAGTGGSGSDLTQTFVYGNSATLKDATAALTKSGYSISGWAATDGGAKARDLSSTYSAAADLILYPVWSAKTYTITYKAGTGGSGTDLTQTFVYGNTATLKDATAALTKTGYAISGWSTTNGGSKTNDLSSSYSAAADLILYPVWSANTYTITYKAGTGGSGSDLTQTFVYGNTATLKDSTAALTKSGYSISGWSTTNGGTKTNDLSSSYSSAADLTLYPVWGPLTYTITYKAGTGGSGSDLTQTFVYGNTATLKDATAALTKTGYAISGWSTTDGGSQSYALSGSYSSAANLNLYPVWGAVTYTITYKRGTNGTGVDVVQTFVYGNTATLGDATTALIRVGYTISGWATTDGGAKSNDLSSSYSSAANLNLYPVWLANTYTVTFDATTNGGTALSPNTSSFTVAGSALTLKTPAGRSGYTASGWHDAPTGGNKIGNAGATGYSPTSDVILYFQWTPIAYTVTYNGNSNTGGTVPTNASTYNIGNSVTVAGNTNSLVRTGYSFDGWTDNSSGTGTVYTSGTGYTVGSANVAFYAKWSANTYTITYNANGGTGEGSATTDTYTTAGTAVTLPTVGSLAKTGYNFGGWSATTSGSALSGTYTTSVDVTLYAKWTIKTITVTYDKGSASVVPSWPSNASGNYNSSITLGTPTSQVTIGGGTYQFSSWLLDGTAITYSSGISYTLPAENVTLKAQWVQVFEVNYTFNGGTSATGHNYDSQCDPSTYLCLANQSIQADLAPTRSGYTFAGWRDQSGNPIAAGATFTVTINRYLLSAQWTPIDYTITYAAAGGATTPTQASKQISQTFTVASGPSRTGYTFGGWSDGSLTYGAGATYTVGTSDVTLTAQWTANVYTIYYDWNGGTGSSTSNASYTVGNSAVTLPVVGDHVKDGYQFAGWSTTSNGTSVGLSYTPTATTTLYALWIPGTYTITYDGNGGTAATSSASITNGSAATLPTATRTSYVFNGWFTAATGGSLLGAASASFTPTQSRTAYAQWTQLSLSGISPSALTRVGTFASSSLISTSFSGSNADSSVSVSVPAGAFTTPTNINLDLVGDFSRASSLISNLNNYIVSIVVSWVASDGTVPDTASGKPVTVVITNSTIKRGMSVYSIAGPTVALLGTATVDGAITVQLTSDPEVVVAATKPGAPTSVTATTGADVSSVISWTAPTSDGGSSITGYAVTSSGGQTCTTSGATTCTVTGLTNGTAYTFTVKAINAIGQSSASSASSAATPAGATPAPSSPGNSGGNGNSSNGNNGNGNGNNTVIKVEKEGNKSTLTWTAPSSVVVTIESSKGETKTETVVGNSLTLTTPKPGEGYKVSADAPLADGTVFKDYIVATPPTKPAVLTVTDPVGPAVLKAKWKATSTVEKYSVKIAPATGKSTTFITKNTSVPLKLIPGKKYTITVTAIGFGNLKSKVLTKTFIAPKKK